MIQDIFPDIYSVAYEVSSPNGMDRILIFDDGRVLLAENGHFPKGEELGVDENWQSVFLFRIGEIGYYLVEPDEAKARLGADYLKYRREPLHSIRQMSDTTECFAGYTGAHLASFYKENRFCGCCGAPMTLGLDERKVVCTNPSCRHPVYPRINPCVIVAVHDHDRLLMTKYRGRRVNWFVLIAGFIEIGESAEAAVTREVFEEAGVRVKNIRYFGSQPWGIPGNLTLGYTAQLDGDDTIRIEEDELCDGAWFNRSEVPIPDDSLSITAEMIRAFAEGRI